MNVKTTALTDKQVKAYHRIKAKRELQNMLKWYYEFRDKYDGTHPDHVERLTNADGGAGSGNWGHKGVPGQRGGSAPGGGKANRITDKTGGFTSAAKQRKQGIGDNAKKLNDDFQSVFNENVEHNKNHDTSDWYEKHVAIDDKAAKILDDAPNGTMIVYGSKLYTKKDDGRWWSDDEMAALGGNNSFEISGKLLKGETPYKFINSKDEAGIETELTLKNDSEYASMAQKLNGQSKAKLISEAQSDPEMKKLVDTVTLYTEGGYKEQKRILEKTVENGLDHASTMDIEEYTHNTPYETRSLYEGQDIKSSTTNVAEGMVMLTETINNSKPTSGTLYRAAGDESISHWLYQDNDPYVPPKVGDTVKMTAPTSFTSDKSIADDIMKDYVSAQGDRVLYTLESGANAVNVSKLSRYNQKEWLSCGEYEVTSVETTVSGKYYVGSEPSRSQKLRGIKKDNDGNSYVELYDTKVTIKQVGKTEFGQRSDAEDIVTYPGQLGEPLYDRERDATSKAGR